MRRARGVPLLRLQRPGWSPGPGDAGTGSADLDAAAAAIAGLGERVLLTTGRQGLPAFAQVRDAWFLVRCVEPPEPPLPPRHSCCSTAAPTRSTASWR